MDMFTVKKRSEVLELLANEFRSKTLRTEYVNAVDAVGRIVSKAIHSQENIPDFMRSTVDGYAVKAENTVGCSESLPAFLEIIGEIEMGKGTDLVLGDQEAVYVPTGAIIPQGANAVVMIEYTEKLESEVVIHRPVHPLENMVGIGDDVGKGELVIPQNTRLKTQHIGALAALGISRVEVYEKPRIGILSTGDELVAIDQPLAKGQIRDVNTHSLEAMISAIGCNVVYRRRIQDKFQAIQAALQEGLTQCDVVLISGGSSVGAHDMTPEIINSLGEPGVLVHGVAIKPGKPTIVGKIQDKAVFGLPGHPASCVVSYKTLVEPFIETALLKMRRKPEYVVGTSEFQAHVSSGRDVFYMVRLEEHEDGYRIHPVHGKSGMVSLFSQADGYVEIPMEKEGLEYGEQIKVYVFK